jgi:S-adenosylmethionine:tRNA ribosyltransferase-isomerase
MNLTNIPVKLDLFTYNLPPNRIAERPISPPSAAKMLAFSRASGTIDHSTFTDLPKYLNKNDLLVFNNTKVIPARLFGKIDQKEQECELLLVKQDVDNSAIWTTLIKPTKKLRIGECISFSKDLKCLVLEKQFSGEFRVEFIGKAPDPTKEIFAHGNMPIPPYIRKGRADEQDRADYQSVFAAQEGSIAAPTASLHFCPNLIDKLKDIGVNFCFLTLHLSTPSFRPIDRQVVPGTEICYCSTAEFEKIKETKAREGRIIAIGTSMVRSLEALFMNPLLNEYFPVDLFITPDFKFNCISAMVTNYHQSGTTHLAIVEAFIRRKALKQIYAAALKENYRFLSYGDGMFLF